MEKLLEKIDSYNIFTNIIPGFLLLIFNEYYFNISGLNVGEQIIIAYFAGQTLNRLGSILLGKILLKFTKENGENYSKYIKASNGDEKISKLLQERNTFRTICTMLIICLLEIPLSKIITSIKVSKDIIVIIMLILLIIIYAISFCRYNKYITDRVRNFNNNNKRKK